MDEATSHAVRQAFGYIFETPSGSLYPPLLNDKRMTTGQPVRIDGAGGPVEALPFLLEHGEIPALGLRFGDIAYTPDLNGIPRDSLRYLEALDLWIIDGLRYKPHPTHSTVDRSVKTVEQLSPRRAFFTHICHDLSHERAESLLPSNIRLAYDGLEIEVESSH